MVVDGKVSYIGTSNWVADYFINTGGVGFVASSVPLSSVLQTIFNRD